MKKLSILGDSLSTFELVIPKGHITFYDSFNAGITGIASMEDTWWGMLINKTGYKLLANNSYSGSRVARIPGWDVFPSACCEERILKLQQGEDTPDVIIIYMGTNDWGYGVPIVDPDSPECGFEYAYNKMLELVKQHYPNALVYCCTLTACYFADKPYMPFNYAYGGLHMEWYNDIIRLTANKFGCKIIDLFTMPPYASIDGAHANKQGMETICNNMLNFIDL